jgi:hypothetical protein
MPPMPWPTGFARVLLYVGIPCALGFFLLLVTSAGLATFALAMALAAIASWAVWQWPAWGAVALVALVPVNRFLLFLLYAATHAGLLVRLLELWKDGLVAVLFVRVIHEAFLRRRSPRLFYLDLLVLAFLTLSLLYVVYPGVVVDNTLAGRILGFRIDSFFYIAYFIGRGLPVTPADLKRLALALVPGSLAAFALAVPEFLAPSKMAALYDRLGYLGYVAVTAGSTDAPLRFREASGIRVPRASSTLMGEVQLAFYQLIAVALAAALLFIARRKLTQPAAIAFMLMMLATVVMTATRSAIIAVAVIVPLLTVWAFGYGKIAIVLLTLVMFSLVYAAHTGLTERALSYLLSSDEPSAQGHEAGLQNGLRIMRQDPLGRGLGTEHTVAFQLGTSDRNVSESWYFQIGTEMGILAGLLYTVIISTATVTAFVMFRRVRDPWLRVITLTTAGAGVGFMIVGAVLHVWEVPVMAALFWLFVGLSVSAPATERSLNLAPAATP